MGPKLDYNKGVAQKFNHPICVYICMYLSQCILGKQWNYQCEKAFITLIELSAKSYRLTMHVGIKTLKELKYVGGSLLSKSNVLTKLDQIKIH